MQLWGHHLPGLQPQSAQGLSVFRVLDGMLAVSWLLPWRWRQPAGSQWGGCRVHHLTAITHGWHVVRSWSQEEADGEEGKEARLDNQFACLSISAAVMTIVELWCCEALKAISQSFPVFHLSSCTQVICCSSLNPYAEEQNLLCQLKHWSPTFCFLIIQFQIIKQSNVSYQFFK